jgi:hypothetical protein
LKNSSNPPGVYTSIRRAGSGPAFHMVWGTRRGFITQQPASPRRLRRRPARPSGPRGCRARTVSSPTTGVPAFVRQLADLRWKAPVVADRSPRVMALTWLDAVLARRRASWTSPRAAAIGEVDSIEAFTHPVGHPAQRAIP